MAGVSDLIKLAVSNAVSNAAKTAASAAKSTSGTRSSGSSGSSVTQSQRDRDNQTISKPGGTLYYGDGRAAVTNTGKSWKDGVDYSTEADKYADAGDWGGVNDILMRREDKMKDTGMTGVKSNLVLWKELNDKYNGPSAGTSLAEMQAGAGRAFGTTGGQYGTDTAWPSYGTFEDFLAGTGYDQYAAQTQAAIKAAVQNAVNGYRDQIDTTNRDSDELARQAYIAKMQGQKNLDQQMAAGGYAGGMADSQRIATESDYQNRLGDIEKQRLATVKELESAITNAQLTGDMQTAQELASYLQNIQSQWTDYIQNQQSINNQNYWNQKNLDMQTTENNRSWALQQLAKGIMPDEDTLTAAGISKQDAQQQVALALAQINQQAAKRTTTGGGYNNGSLISSQVQELQKALGVTADGLWGSNSKAAAGGMTADQAWVEYQKQNPGNSRFSGLAYQTLIQNKQYDEADAYLAQYWDTMSDTDRTRANIIANKYGPK